MSHVTRRKHVLKEMFEDDFELPNANQQIVRVVSSRGNNLHEVEAANIDHEHFLVTMPTKFRRNVWVKRGDYILVESIEEGDRVKAEICKILTPKHIKEYAKRNIWPQRFSTKINTSMTNIESNNKCDSKADNLEPNLNRPVQTVKKDYSNDDSGDSQYLNSEDED